MWPVCLWAGTGPAPVLLGKSFVVCSTQEVLELIKPRPFLSSCRLERSGSQQRPSSTRTMPSSKLLKPCRLTTPVSPCHLDLLIIVIYGFCSCCLNAGATGLKAEDRLCCWFLCHLSSIFKRASRRSRRLPVRYARAKVVATTPSTRRRLHPRSPTSRTRLSLPPAMWTPVIWRTPRATETRMPLPQWRRKQRQPLTASSWSPCGSPLRLIRNSNSRNRPPPVDCPRTNWRPQFCTWLRLVTAVSFSNPHRNWAVRWRPRFFVEFSNRTLTPNLYIAALFTERRGLPSHRA